VQDGAAVTELPDGSVQIDLTGRGSKPDPIDDKFNANSAEKMDDGELAVIASELLEGIKRDGESRREHLDMISEGIKLLGLVIETATATSVSSSALLRACRRYAIRCCSMPDSCFRQTRVGDLLPAEGHVKVRDDRPQKPKNADHMGHNNGPISTVASTHSRHRRRRKRPHKLRRASPRNERTEVMKQLKYIGEATRRSQEMRQKMSNKRGFANGNRVKAYPQMEYGEGRREKIEKYGGKRDAGRHPERVGGRDGTG
jgi:hypothetical protein